MSSRCGAAASDAGRDEDAVRELIAAIRLRPDFAEAYANRAGVYVEPADVAAAEADAARAWYLGIDRARLEELIRDAKAPRRRG